MFKKARNSDGSPLSTLPDDDSPRQDINPRRKLYRDTPKPAPRRKPDQIDKPKLDNATENLMESLVDRLSIDISNRFSELNDRIDRLEKSLEQRISNNVAQILDKRISTEMNRLRKDVDAHIEIVADSIKAKVAADLADINKKIDSVNPALPSDLSCNIVVRNLQEHQNENVQEKVSTLIKEGCGVQDVPIISAERKKGPQGKAGVIVVKLRSIEDKKRVMQNKRKLKHSRRFQKVYIQHDQSRTDRLLADNFRTMLTAIKSGNHNLTIKGSRVVKNDYPTSNSSRQGTTDSDSHRYNGRQHHSNTNNQRNPQYQSRR